MNAESIPSSIGVPRIGGHIQLTDHMGNAFDSTNLNRFMLLYFGFTHCPDICPEELDKLGEVVSKLSSFNIQPLFVTVDPDRDNTSILSSYLEQFSPKIIGLTGSRDEIQTAAKQYRVYYRPSRTASTPPEQTMVDRSTDYLMDHSTFIFLVAPDGTYLAHYGRESSVERTVTLVKDAMDKWNATSEKA